MKQNALAARTGLAIAILACAGMATGQNLLQLIQKAPRMQSAGAPEFGTSQESFYTVGEWDFDPVTSNQTYSDIVLETGNVLRYSTAGSVGFFAGVHPPDGAVLTSVTFDLCDSNEEDSHLTATLYSCDAVNASCSSIGGDVVSVSNIALPCHAYTQDLSAFGFTVNNQTQRLLLWARTLTVGDTNAIAGATVGYKLQVSPAPGSATFGDVPTNHPFFQYVEALAKSGITGGCGSGNYCPNAPLTRGQMAVFLAKGLGLQWP
jgi:hypothetical protein